MALEANIFTNKKESGLTIEEEALLIKRSLEGDNSAFEKLYRHNVSGVYAVCLRISVNRDKAEELTQDVFVTAWEKLSSFRNESKFSTWLHRIAVNTVLTDLRSKRRWLSRFKYFDNLFNYEKKTSISPGNSIDLEKAIAYLPEKARIVFVLHDIEGYKHEEIAEMMSNSTGTTKAQLHRARKILREALSK